MKIGLLVDSTCDLPDYMFGPNGITLMPCTVRIGGREIEDVRDEQQTIKLHNNELTERLDTFAESAPYSADQIEKLVMERLVLEYDHVFCLTVTLSRSDTYKNAMEAARRMVSKYRAVRLAAGLSSRFSLVVINSRSIFTGQAVLATEIMRMIQADAKPSEIDLTINELVPHTYAYMVPPDLYFLYKRGVRRGDQSINWAGYTLGSFLDIKPIICGHMDDTGPVARLRKFDVAVNTMFANATKAIKQGLLAPQVCVSYGGDPVLLEKMPGFAEMREAAQIRGISVLTSPMSMTGAVHVGPGGVSVAFISDRHHFEEHP